MKDRHVDRNQYRRFVRVHGLTAFAVQVEQTDLLIRAQRDLSAEAFELVHQARDRVKAWGIEHPEFFTSLTPLPPTEFAPPPVRNMLDAARRTGVGPMAAVAGAIAEYVGRGLAAGSPAGVMVENGGDIYLSSTRDVLVGLFAGKSNLSMRLGLNVSASDTPLGICTSSGTVGHSLSMGRADAATVVAESAALADAAATALGNRIGRVQDIEPALEWVLTINGVRGAVVMMGDKIGLLGGIDLVGL